MKRVVRLVSALSAGASLAWGIARALRKGSKRDAAPPWPETPAAPAPKPAASVAPAPAEPVEAAAEPVEAPVAEEKQEILIKGVVVYDAAALLAFVNDADSEAFKEAGVKGKALAVLEGARPFASAEALGSTAGVGRRTLQALCAAAGS